MKRRLLTKLYWILLLQIPLVLVYSQSFSNDLYLQTSEVNNTMIHYNADKESILRFYSTNPNNRRQFFNDTNYDTPERRARRFTLIDSYLNELTRLDFDGMNINGKVDYILFKRNLESEKYALQQQEIIYNQVKKYFPFESKLFALEVPRRRGIQVKGDEVAKEMESIRKSVSLQIKSFNKADSLEKSQSEYAIANVNAMQGILKKYFSFYNGYDPLFTWWVPQTYSELDSTLSVYGTLLKANRKLSSSQKDDGSGIIGNPIGRRELIRQLQTEFIPYSPEELIEIANKEFAWCDKELLKASNEMGFGTNWKAALEKVKNTYVDPGKQPEAMFDLYKQSVDFLKKNNLLTIPALAEEDWSMYMMSPEAQKVNPFFLGGESLIISYPTNTMSYDDKMMSMRGNNPHFSRATVHHELIAGHHLQWYMKDRYKTYRNFETPFWVEGNSLYWEMLLWDLNFPRSAEDRMGMLFWRMHRCARILFSLNYHLGNWTPQECIDFLVDRVGHERANAEGEVRRSFTGNYGPLYQIAYMIGGLQFMALKKELVDSRKMTYQQYHDAILRENAMPIEMLRALLTNQKLTRDYKTNWKFYNK
ncbi:MAG: DUF885 family protein [Saprospiraceae bacterium]